MKLTHAALVVATIFTVAGTAQAASDGTLGASSVGSADVTIAKDDVVLITELAEVNIAVPATVTGELIGSTPACVFSTTGNYTVSVTTDLLLENGTDSIPFTLQ